MANTRSIEMTEALTPKAIEEIRVGNVLTFMQEGQRVDYKITRRAKGRVWAKKTLLVDPNELQVVDVKIEKK